MLQLKPSHKSGWSQVQLPGDVHSPLPLQPAGQMASLQVAPVHSPATQVQVSGLEHVPPFSHGVLQMAVKKRKKTEIGIGKI